ncbi:oligomeric, coiled-coil, peripheral membrane protein [Saccharomyces pastorianus]|uniref:Autophagy-related protein 11 n=1 Tax=Saccharomyces pastorianus TaxID=27292 RepID=A0A6C1EIB9_SACPS|nr:oligomeric, coiled-coil, peripheral membrane protein [Saccharomyces pastorianus]
MADSGGKNTASAEQTTMPLQTTATIINAISGESITTNVNFFVSLDEFKQFMTRKWNIPPDRLLILLPYGNKLKPSMFKELLINRSFTLNEFYVYDRRLFSLVHKPTPVNAATSQDISFENTLNSKDLTQTLEYLIKNSHVGEGSDTIMIKPMPSPLEDADVTVPRLDYHTVTSLLTTNLGWLSALEIDVHYFRSLIPDIIAQITHIFNSLTVCSQYLKLYCFDVETLYNSNVQFLNQLIDNGMTSKWEKCFKDTLSKLTGLEGDSLQKFTNVESLLENEKSVKFLNHSINNKLNKIKREIDENSNFRDTITKNIDQLRQQFTPNESKYELEDKMAASFKDLVSDLRSRSRDVLDKEPEEFNDQAFLKSMNETLEKDKKNSIKSLFTISQALYCQTEELMNLKKRLQMHAIVTLGNIAFTQMEILGIKKLLLNDCNKDLELYKKYEVEFAQVEDLPLIYGLYLMEKYRRLSWFQQIVSFVSSFDQDLELFKQNELHTRSRWIKNFGSIATVFCEDLLSSSDFDKLNEYHSIPPPPNDKEKHKDKNAITQYHKGLQELSQVIDNYMVQIKETNVPEPIIDLLSKTLTEAKRFHIIYSNFKTHNNNSFNSSNNSLEESVMLRSDELVKGYKTRIKKLESLLHELQYSDVNHWPLGILNTHIKPFHSIIPSVNKRKFLSASVLLEPSDLNNSSIPQINGHRVEELESNLQDLLQQIQSLKDENIQKSKEISDMRRNLSDAEVEKTAYRETLTNLNQELARLTNEEQSHKTEIFALNVSFKKHLNDIVDHDNEKLININKLKSDYDDVFKSRERLQVEMSEIRKTHKEEIDSLKNAIERLNGQITTLEKSESEAKSSSIEKIENIDTISFRNDGNMNDMVSTQALQDKMFDIISTNVFILENIGLLLTFDNNNNIQIRRVKGLKKGVTQSNILDESTQMLDTADNSVIKSPVFQKLKDEYNLIKSSVNGVDKDAQQSIFVENIAQLYDNKLYEVAVIRRFKDIETLAKKLTKENKIKRTVLERCQREKVTLRNFQIGDLALFLPTRENVNSVGSMSSSTSSLSSSFSSVDLSTPPPLDAMSIQSSPSIIHSNIVSQGNTASKEKSKQMRPWAAFTAFEENTRYFLKDEKGLTKGKEWFVGRIITLEHFVADSSSNNPLRLPKGAVWFQVTAVVVSYQGI